MLILRLLLENPLKACGRCDTGGRTGSADWISLSASTIYTLQQHASASHASVFVGGW